MKRDGICKNTLFSHDQINKCFFEYLKEIVSIESWKITSISDQFSFPFSIHSLEVITSDFWRPDRLSYVSKLREKQPINCLLLKAGKGSNRNYTR